MIQGVVELYSESKLRTFPKAADRCRFAEGKIRIELSWSVHDALPRTPVSGRPVGSNCGRPTDCRLVNPVIQTSRRSARRHQILVCRAWAKCGRGGGGETIDGASTAVDQSH